MSTTTALAAPDTPLLTAEEYFQISDVNHHTELIDGRIVEMSMPGFRHGEVCGNAYFALRSFAESSRLGRVVSNDSGIITRREPDTVRGADLAFYSYAKLPADQSPAGYPEVRPDLVVEVKSPTDRWSDVLIKVTEYLQADVNIVCVIDPEREQIQTYRQNDPVQLLNAEQSWTVPEALPGFELPVTQIFR